MCLCSRYSPCNGDPRWQQPSSAPGGPYLAYPLLTSPQPPVSSDYAYYQLLPAPCSPMMGFYPPFPTPYGGPLQTGMVSPLPADCSDRSLPPAQDYSVACQRGRGPMQTAVLPVVRTREYCMVRRHTPTHIQTIHLLYTHKHYTYTHIHTHKPYSHHIHTDTTHTHNIYTHTHA